MMVVLIIGRWLLPKGEITRQQLSQLLLVYLGTAADIVELFELFKEEAVAYDWELSAVVLVVWSVSLIQFSLVITTAKSGKKPRYFSEHSLP